MFWFGKKVESFFIKVQKYFPKIRNYSHTFFEEEAEYPRWEYLMLDIFSSRARVEYKKNCSITRGNI